MGVSQRDHERLKPEGPLTREIPAFGALARFHDRPVGIDQSVLEELVRLRLPDAKPCLVDRVLERINFVRRLESTAEVTAVVGSGIRRAPSMSR